MAATLTLKSMSFKDGECNKKLELKGLRLGMCILNSA